ncbi:hypothetical protein EYC84_007541 [Monilinia fructicola]|uniref:Uncharacterized protein n=1 Tax=Monilinia fructicola TaxID=38448 RepID=A0A5M9JG39_MONFR|nr:hypothetical protein EYC84_007541 [Monilinia fructicola]
MIDFYRTEDMAMLTKPTSSYISLPLHGIGSLSSSIGTTHYHCNPKRLQIHSIRDTRSPLFSTVTPTDFCNHPCLSNWAYEAHPTQ